MRHNQLQKDRHAIFAGDDGVRIVDFTEAELHDCAETYPETESDNIFMGLRPPGCEELENLEAWCNSKSESLTPRRNAKLADRKRVVCQMSSYL